MKIRIKYLVFILVFGWKPIGVSAQKTIFSDSLWQKEILQNPYLVKDTAYNFTNTKLYFRSVKPNFHRVQSAQQTQEYTFETQGISINENWKLSGFLKASRMNEKNVAYNLSEERTIDKSYFAPYYYYVPKKAEWKNNKVNFRAIAAKSFFNENWVSQLSVAGFWGKYARISDPRPEITKVDYSAELLLGTKIANTFFAIKYGIRKNDKILNYYYENEILNNIGFPETMMRFDEGFGNNYIYRGGNSQNKYIEIENKAGLEWYKTWKNNTLKFDYAYSEKISKIYDGNFQSRENLRFMLYGDRHFAQLFFNNSKGNNSKTYRIFYSQSTETNYNNRTLYTSFTNDYKDLGVEFSLKKENRGGNAKIKFSQLKLADRSVQIDKNTQMLFLQSSYFQEFIFSKNKGITVSPTMEFYFPLYNQLGYLPFGSDTANDLVESVIISNYYYDKIIKMNLGIKLLFNYYSGKNILQPYIIFNNDIFLDKRNENLSNIYQDKGFYINLGINIYY